MESSSPVQRSNNTTPHHNFYSSTGTEQPHSFPNSIISNQSQLSFGNSPLDSVSNNARRTPHLFTTQTSNNNTPSRNHRRINRSQNQSPSIHSSTGSNVIDSSISPVLLNHHIHHYSSDNRICGSSGTNSNSITPPNSNSNTTISCVSGNSTSANIGMPTTPKATLNHNNNHIKRRTDLENLKNNSEKGKSKAKKCILEEDDNDIEKCGDIKKSGPRTRTSWVGPNQEFLPICDALFNVISLAAYFCDIVFDILTAYTWYNLNRESDDEFSPTIDETDDESFGSETVWQWSIVAIVFIALSTLLSQALSFKWYKESVRRGQTGPDGVELEGPPPPCSTGVLVLMHVSLCGVLWRYFKLFIPVDLRFVKNEVRDLCLLRLVHAFCEAAPMLLIQLYLIWQTPGPAAVSDFTIVSTSLSLFSVCWALASFSKNVRKQNVHKLVLTWLGVIFQFLWHLGTVISRAVALSLYAAVYQWYIFLVLVLHWFCMLMWLISPKNLYHGEKISTLRKIGYSTIIAVVYTFCYVNVQERNSRQTVIIYYVTMFLENSLLLGVWLIAKRYEDEIWYKGHVIVAVFACFIGGIVFMCLYYRYFHLKRLSYVYDTASSIYKSSSIVNGGSSLNINGTIYSSPGGAKGVRGNGSFGTVGSPREILGRKHVPANGKTELTSTTNSNNLTVIISNGGPAHESNMDSKGAASERYSKRNGLNIHDSNKGLKSDKTGGGQRSALYNKINGHHIHHPNVPGVFNCRFHPAMNKRKKKKPTSFVPPPAVQTTSSSPVVPATASASSPLNSLGNHEDVVGAAGGNHFHSPSPQQLHQRSSIVNEAPNHHQPFGEDRETFMRNGGVGGPAAGPDMIGNERSISSLENYVVGDGGSGLNFDPAGPLYGKMPIVLPGQNGGRMVYPFWKRPLSITFGSENEGSVGSRVDIQQKLQEKKQQQLAELREIEEEIKQGKLKRPQFNEIPQPVTVRQPIPVEKKQPWFQAQQDEREPPMMMMIPRPPLLVPASEVVLDPHYLMYASPTFDGNDGYYDSPEWPINYYEPLYQNDAIRDEGDGGSGSGGGDNGPGMFLGSRKKHSSPNHAHTRSSKESIYKSYRLASDIDSQMSLPRSYTLPREFKYRRKFRKPIKTEQFLPSTNSSDGDVDSGDEDQKGHKHSNPFPLPVPSMVHLSTDENSNLPRAASSSAPQPSKKNPPSRRQRLHETKL